MQGKKFTIPLQYKNDFKIDEAILEQRQNQQQILQQINNKNMMQFPSTQTQPYPIHPTATEIIISRTAVETRLRCTRERYLGYDFEDGGLEKIGHKYEAFFGELMHQGLAQIVQSKPLPEDIFGKLELGIRERFTSSMPEEHLEHMLKEQTQLLKLLFEGWRTYRLPTIKRDFHVVAVEQEKNALFKPLDYLPQSLAQSLLPVRMPLRMDVFLRRKSDELLFIMDFKSTSQASMDWNMKLDNSLQSCLYLEGAKQIYDEPIGGIWYEGLVKGRREMDDAISSPYRGQVIQYGSFLYGWKTKDGTAVKEYAKGRTREFLPDTVDFGIELANEMGFDMKGYFPCTIPWSPLSSHRIVRQMIVNENRYFNDLQQVKNAAWNNEAHELELALFEQTLDSCYKYGNKHPCPFVELCHGGLHESEISNVYTKREDHHNKKETENDQQTSNS